MRIIITMFYIILVILAVSFAGLNATPVQVNFYFTSLNMPVSVLIIYIFGIGVIGGFIMFLFKYWRLKTENFKIKNQLKLTEKEIKNLRAIPLKDQH